MNIYWTSRKSIYGLKHFVLINHYELEKEVYLDFVSVLDESISFTISKKVFEKSNQWIKGWNDNVKDNIDFKEYLKFKSSIGGDKTHKIILNENSSFNIS